MIKKIYRKLARMVTRNLVLWKESRTLRPLTDLMPSRDIAKIESLLENQAFRRSLSAADIDAKTLDSLVRLLGSKDQGRKILIRPHNFAGHLTHYHHFFGAVILPLLEWASAGVVSQGDVVLVRDCGPLNPEIEQWSGILGVQATTIPIGLVPCLAGSAMVEVWDAPSYDFSFRDDWYPRKMIIEKIRNHVFQLIHVSSDQQTVNLCEPKIVVVARGKADPFYKSRKADTKTCGADRRSIPNLEELVDELSKLSKDVQVAYLEDMRVSDKIHLFKHADLVVGQMGAGLNNAIWMEPGSALIEILSLEGIRLNFTVFANICNRAEVRHRRVVQESNHAAVNIPLIMGFAKDLIVSRM